MRPSALLLKSYIVTDVNLTANRAFDPEKPVNLGIRDLIVEPDCRKDDKRARDWRIFLCVKDAQNNDSNSPYSFRIELVGFFEVEEQVPAKTQDVFACVNGTSVLYSTAREVLRSLMSMGPYQPILLPAVCFFEDMHRLEGGGEKGVAVAVESGTVKPTGEHTTTADAGTASLHKVRAKQSTKRQGGKK